MAAPSWKFWLLLFVWIGMAILALPSAIRIGARIFCHEPPQNISLSDHLKRNSRNLDTDKLVVFIHGVNSNSRSAWLNTQTDAYWPEMLTADTSLPQDKVFDVFLVDYPSPFICHAPGVTPIADNLRTTLGLLMFQKYRQIFIVAHSMGGLVAERMLIDLQLPSLSKFKAIFFFGSPTGGAGIANLAALFSDNRQYADMANYGSPFLRDLGNGWKKLRTDSTTSALAPKSLCGYENYATSTLRVVPENYEDAYRCDEDSVPLESKHTSLTKPASRDVLVYQFTRDHLLSFANPFSPVTSAILTKHTAKLEDCWLDGDRCGFRFSTGEVVPLNVNLFTGDIVLMNQTDQTKTPTSDPAMLFATNDTPPYGGGRDTGAKAGIIEMPASDLDEVKEAPSTGYGFHWFPVKEGHVYCVRTRDGLHFAKIKIKTLTSKNAAFDWVYQPAQTASFAGQ